MIKKIPVLFFAIFLIGLAVCINIAAFAQRSGNKPPNVILLYADDLGYGDVSCYGTSKVSTPNIDRLAAEGLRFTNGHCTASTCTPSRFSILTGEYAWREKGTNILPGDAALIIPTNKTTLGTIFQKAGYHTAAIGKWHLGLGEKDGPDWNRTIAPGPNEVGFDYAFFFPATADRVPTVYIENHRVVALDSSDPIAVNYHQQVGHDPTGREHPELLKMQSSPGHGHDQTIVNGIGRIGWMSGGRKARWVDETLAADFVNQAASFIEKNKEHPFFLYFAFSDIHVPRMPDTRFKGKSGLGYRGDAILQLDWSVGQILKQLDYLGLAENTIVIFTSDNGPVLNDGYQDGAVEQLNGHRPTGVMRGGKYSILEGGTRVPFIIRWPGNIKPGATSDALISQVDFSASFAALLHQELPSGDAPDSFNQLSALLGKSSAGRETFVEKGRTLALIKGDWKYIVPHKGIRVLPLTNIESGLDTLPQLYNLKEDVMERKNVAGQHPGMVKEMSAQLEKIKTAGHTREW